MLCPSTSPEAPQAITHIEQCPARHDGQNPPVGERGAQAHQRRVTRLPGDAVGVTLAQRPQQEADRRAHEAGDGARGADHHA